MGSLQGADIMHEPKQGREGGRCCCGQGRTPGVIKPRACGLRRQRAGMVVVVVVVGLGVGVVVGRHPSGWWNVLVGKLRRSRSPRQGRISAASVVVLWGEGQFSQAESRRTIAVGVCMCVPATARTKRRREEGRGDDDARGRNFGLVVRRSGLLFPAIRS